VCFYGSTMTVNIISIIQTPLPTRCPVVSANKRQSGAISLAGLLSTGALISGHITPLPARRVSGRGRDRILLLTRDGTHMGNERLKGS
jgi:hypothetical protein